MKLLIRLGSLLAGVSTLCCLSAQTTVPIMVDTLPQMRKILIEEFTGLRCTFCPAGHLNANNIVADHPGKAFIINYHQGAFAIPIDSLQDLRTQWGDSLYKQSKAEGWPNGTISRHIFKDGKTSTDYKQWPVFAPQVLEMPSYVNVAAKATLNKVTRRLTVTAEMYYTAEPSVSSNFLNVAILQDSIADKQLGAERNHAQILPNGKYNLMHTLRELVTGQWGDEITGISNKKLITREYSYIIPEEMRKVPVVLDNIHILVFVNESRHESLNADTVSLTYTYDEPDYMLYMQEGTRIKNNSCDNASDFSVKLQNKGTVPIENITVEYKSSLGTEERVLPINGLSLNKDTSLILNFESPVNTKEDVEIRLLKINGKTYSHDYKNKVSIYVEKWAGFTASPNVTLKLVQNQYGSETTWRLIHGSDTLTKGGPYRDLESMGTKENKESLVLKANGCYILRMLDSEGNGINNDYGKGYIEILDDKGNHLTGHDGKYTNELNIFIKKTDVSNTVEKELTQNFTISPNPVSNQAVSLSFVLDAAKTLNISVYDLSGRSMINPIIYNGQEGMNRKELSVNNLKAGIYMVSICSNDGSTAVRRLVVK